MALDPILYILESIWFMFRLFWLWAHLGGDLLSQLKFQRPGSRDQVAPPRRVFQAVIKSAASAASLAVQKIIKMKEKILLQAQQWHGCCTSNRLGQALEVLRVLRFLKLCRW